MSVAEDVWNHGHNHKVYIIVLARKIKQDQYPMYLPSMSPDARMYRVL